MKNQLFHNTGKGRFVETSTAGGAGVRRAEIGRGAAFGDVDNDGDTDIVVTNNGGPVRLLLNQAGQQDSHWLQVSACAAGAATASASARWIGLERAGQPALWRRVRTDGSYLVGQRRPGPLRSGCRCQGGGAVVVQWPDGVGAMDRMWPPIGP